MLRGVDYSFGLRPKFPSHFILLIEQ